MIESSFFNGFAWGVFWGVLNRFPKLYYAAFLLLVGLLLFLYIFIQPEPSSSGRGIIGWVAFIIGAVFGLLTGKEAINTLYPKGDD